MRPVTIDGVTYPSASAAAVALGLTRQAISARLRGADAWVTPPPYRYVGRSPTRVEIDGVVATVREHADRLGVSRNTIYLRIRADKLRAAEPTWIDLDVERPMYSLRHAAGLSPEEALDRVSEAEGYAVPMSTLTTPETRGTAIQLARLLARARAYGLTVRIMVAVPTE